MDNNNTKILDVASIVTVGGILLYSLGWIYWKQYYQTLDIDISFIDLSIDRIIATTWFIVISALSMTSAAIFDFLKPSKQRYNIVDVTIPFILLPYVLVISFTDNQRYVAIGSLGCVTLYAVFLFIIKKLIFNISFTKSTYTIAFVLGIYLTCLLWYFHTGKSDATIFKDSYKETIEIQISNTKRIRGKFIVLSKNKYFIMTKQKGLVIVNENDAKLVKIYK